MIAASKCTKIIHKFQNLYISTSNSLEQFLTMNFKTVFLYLFLLKLKVNASVEDNLITDYFKMKNIRQITIMSCENKQKYIKLLHVVMKNNYYVSFFNLNTATSEDVEKLTIKHGSQGIFLDADCKKSPEALQQCAEQHLFFDKYKWLIISTNSTVLEILQDTYININAEVTVASQTLSGNTWQLLDVYNPGYNHGGTLKVNDLGTWNGDKGFLINVPDLPKYIMRKDMSEIHFEGISIIGHEYPGDLADYLYNNEDNKIIDNFSRYYFLLFSHVKDIHNFSLSVRKTRFYGSLFPNGSFNGLVGALQRKEVDVGLTSIFYKRDRSYFVDNLVPTYLMKSRFLFIHPKPPLTIGGAFFTPLDNTVWLCTWGVMLITAIIIRLTFKQEWQLERLRGDKENYMEHDWSYIALLIFGGVCQQDVPRVPNMYSGRIIVFVSVFFTYMLYQFYSGGIVSSLLSEPPRTIKNLQDLLHSDFKAGVDDIPYQKAYFDETNDPIALELFKKKIKGTKNGSDGYYDQKVGMAFVKKGDFAFQTDTSSGYAILADEFTNDEICELGEVQLYPTQYMAGVIQQDSPFREVLVYSFQRMIECGLVNRQRIKWTTKKPECIEVVDSSTIFCSIKEFFPALLFYIVGILITLIIFVIEIKVHRRIEAKKPKFIFIK